MCRGSFFQDRRESFCQVRTGGDAGGLFLGSVHAHTTLPPMCAGSKTETVMVGVLGKKCPMERERGKCVCLLRCAP